MSRSDQRDRQGWDGAGAPGGLLKARARRGERRTRRRAAAPLDLVRHDSAMRPIEPDRADSPIEPSDRE